LRLVVLKKKSTDTNTVIIAFPSLIRRIGGDSVKLLREVAAQCRCSLKRVRRSRHWQLTGKAEHLSVLVEQLKEAENTQEFPFFIEKIEQEIAPYIQQSLPIRLAQIIATNPAITLAEMMEKTGCTIAQARLAREQEPF